MSEIAFGIGAAPDGAPLAVVEDRVIALRALAERYRVANPPADMRALMPDWVRWHDWLRGLDLRPDETWQALDAVRFGPPVSEPWNIFQTYHNFERASRVTGKADPGKAARVLPDIFFGSRSALAAYGDVVMREHGGSQFDFEVEVTIVIGKPATRVPAEKWEEYVAGYVIANDYTMHHAWWRPIRRSSPINDNIRMKNFPGYTPLSRAIVPPYLVGDPHDLAVRCTVDGKLRQDTRTTKMLWHMGELIEYLSAIMTLRPGDLILAGSPEELPLPEGETKGLAVGAKVVADVERIGTLMNTIGEHDWRQPNEIGE